MARAIVPDFILQERRLAALNGEQNGEQWGRHPGREPSFDWPAYWRRHFLQRAIAWRRDTRRPASQGERLAAHYAAMPAVALIGRSAHLYLSDSDSNSGC